MLQVIVTLAALLAVYVAVHWLHPHLANRPLGRPTRQAYDAPAADHANTAKAVPHPAFRPGSSGHGLNEHQLAVPYPPHRSIRDLDQGQKVEVG